MPQDYDSLLQLLTNSTALLGPCTPQPALFEEVLRVWRGLAVKTERWRETAALLHKISQYPDCPTLLYKLMYDMQATWDARLLAATLLAMPWQGWNLPPLTDAEDADIRALLAIAYFTGTGATAWYLRQLHRCLDASANTAKPALLPQVCFIKGLCAEALSPQLYAASIRKGGVLNSQVAKHRSFRYLHRLLDYLGLSDELSVQQQYRHLVAEIWPSASVDNYQQWQWITAPGGPELFTDVVAELSVGAWTLPQLHALKYLPLPHTDHLAAFLAPLPLVLQQLIEWLRPEVGRFTSIPGGFDALQWMHSTNKAAANVVYAAPNWWKPWLRDGLPVAREVLQRLQDMQLPAASPDIPQDRYQWLETHYFPHYRQICANLLLGQTANGDSLTLIIQLAQKGDLPAIRALGVAEDISPAIIDALSKLAKNGTMPEQHAARHALEQLARRLGLPGMQELQRQTLLAIAWDPGPLQGGRVRVLWEEGGYRIRLALHRGKVELQVLGINGIISPIPNNLRQSAIFHEARDAQRQAQAQYRLFKQMLESNMLQSLPIAIGEFRHFLHNQIFAHLAERLVWQTSQGETIIWVGPDRWETCDGELIDISQTTAADISMLQLPHPVSLARSRTLIAWQMLAADRRLVQPFKQLFREVYFGDEAHETVCRRFAGRNIEPRRAYALLRAVGFAPGAGVARRTWASGLTTHLCWAEGVVSHDLFGEQRKEIVRTGGIWYTRDNEHVPPAEVDDIIISESLRAADLLTTRAAVGDAEMTSQETLALRVTLLREVSRAFDLTNIAVLEECGYAIVLGTLATYRVNLQNGAVLFEPEGRQVLLPNLQQHWQPSEDDVDTTTRILDIILLLAQDSAINDLTFLAQL